MKLFFIQKDAAERRARRGCTARPSCTARFDAEAPRPRRGAGEQGGVIRVADIRKSPDGAEPRAIPERLDYGKASPGAVKAMVGLEVHTRRSGLEHSLIELVKVRASQL